MPSIPFTYRALWKVAASPTQRLTDTLRVRIGVDDRLAVTAGDFTLAVLEQGGHVQFLEQIIDYPEVWQFLAPYKISQEGGLWVVAHGDVRRLLIANTYVEESPILVDGPFLERLRRLLDVIAAYINDVKLDGMPFLCHCSGATRRWSEHLASHVLRGEMNIPLVQVTLQASRTLEAGQRELEQLLVPILVSRMLGQRVFASRAARNYTSYAVGGD